jgi:serine/threonine protein phosphatase 1
MAIYVIGDLHGNLSGLLQCLERSGFRYNEDTLIQLGDVVDGNDDVFECVEELLKIKHLIAIRGNHDAWLLEFIRIGYHPSNWTYGGITTVKSYSSHAGKPAIIKSSGSGFKVSLNPSDIPPHHQAFFERQIPYFLDRHNNLFVHAGFNRFKPFEGQPPEDYYWDRTLWQDALQWQINKHLNYCSEEFEMRTHFNNIFLGHTSTLNWGSILPLKASNIYNLDTGSGKNGRLTIMNVQSKEFWQSEIISF